MSEPETSARRLLAAHMAGSPRAAAQLLPLVYDDLRALAVHYMADERPDHTLQPTALVNEAYLRLVGVEHMSWKGREHFKAMAATMLRRVLVDHARRRNARKRGDGMELRALEDGVLDAGEAVKVLAVDVALEKLARVSPRQARLVELRFFSDLTVAQTAEVMGVGPDVVKSDWRAARAWLECELGADTDRR